MVVIPPAPLTYEIRSVRRDIAAGAGRALLIFGVGTADEKGSVSMLINLVIGLIILGILLLLINKYIPMDGRIKQIINVVIVVGAVLWALQAFGVFAMGGPLMPLIVVLVVLGFLLWLINTHIPMDGTIKKIVNVVVLVVAILAVLQAFGLIPRFYAMGSASTLRAVPAMVVR